MTKFLIFITFLFGFSSWSQSEIFNSKINFSENDLEEFYSAVSIDNNRIYFIANDYTLYVYDKTTKQLLWKDYARSKSNIAPIYHQNYVFEKMAEGKILQLQAITGDTIQTLKIQELTTQPIFKENMMYCVAISPEIGGAILAYDLNKKEIVWQKFIGHGVSFQPYFLKDKMVVNYQEQFWFELDYNGNALNKNENCYSKNTEPPFEEQFCNIPYDVVNQYHKELTTKNMTIDEAKYYYGTNETVILKENELKIINQKNKIKKEIVIDKIITLPESGENSYSEILKVAENTIWFVYENILGVYDFKKNITLKSYDLSTWNPHQVILDGNTIWLISKIDGQLYGLDLDGNADRNEIVRNATPTIQGRIKFLNQKLYEINDNYRTPEGFPKMFYRSSQIFKENGKLKIKTFSSNSETYKETEGYMERNTQQIFDPADIISISNETTNTSDPLGIIVLYLKPSTVTQINKIEKFIKENNSEKLKWVVEEDTHTISDEIGIVFLQTDPNHFLEIKKALEELKLLFENY
jgi:hypothetical protein